MRFAEGSQKNLWKAIPTASGGLECNLGLDVGRGDDPGPIRTAEDEPQPYGRPSRGDGTADRSSWERWTDRVVAAARGTCPTSSIGLRQLRLLYA